jgi:hypothetical protein
MINLDRERRALLLTSQGRRVPDSLRVLHITRHDRREIITENEAFCRCWTSSESMARYFSRTGLPRLEVVADE